MIPLTMAVLTLPSAPSSLPNILVADLRILRLALVHCMSMVLPMHHHSVRMSKVTPTLTMTDMANEGIQKSPKALLPTMACCFRISRRSFFDKSMVSALWGYIGGNMMWVDPPVACVAPPWKAWWPPWDFTWDAPPAPPLLEVLLVRLLAWVLMVEFTFVVTSLFTPTRAPFLLSPGMLTRGEPLLCRVWLEVGVTVG